MPACKCQPTEVTRSRLGLSAQCNQARHGLGFDWAWGPDITSRDGRASSSPVVPFQFGRGSGTNAKHAVKRKSHAPLQSCSFAQFREALCLISFKCKIGRLGWVERCVARLRQAKTRDRAPVDPRHSICRPHRACSAGPSPSPRPIGDLPRRLETNR